MRQHSSGPYRRGRLPGDQLQPDGTRAIGRGPGGRGSPRGSCGSGGGFMGHGPAGRAPGGESCARGLPGTLRFCVRLATLCVG